MSNENAILKKLARIDSDIDTLKARVTKLEYDSKTEGKSHSIEQQLKAIDGLSRLLDEDEKMRFGAFMDSERQRKARIYG